MCLLNIFAEIFNRKLYICLSIFKRMEKYTNHTPKILITGASGFIGSHLVDYALEQGFEVYAGIRKSSSRRYLQDKRIRFVILTMESEAELGGQLEEFRNRYGKWDYIIHAAGVTKSRHKEDFDEVNFEDTRRLVESLTALGMVPDRFIYISSLSIFGPVREERVPPHELLPYGPDIHMSKVGLKTSVYLPIGENDRPAPNTLYGDSKVLAEDYIQGLPDFPWVIFRPTGVYGPRERDYFLMAKSIKQHLDISAGFAPQEITFVYVTDLVRAIFLAIARNINHRAYFVSDGSVYSSRAFSDLLQKELYIKHVIHVKLPLCALKVVSLLAEKIAALCDKSSTLNSDKYKIMKQRNWQCDIRPLIEELGYHPEYPLERGVRETVAWYKQEKWL